MKMHGDNQHNIAIYGLLGRKLGHSWSPKFFSNKFVKEHINAEYRLFETDDIESFINKLPLCNTLKGFNVTIPYKAEIIKYLDFIDPIAKEIGAVNTVKCYYDERGLHLSGYNTDWKGFKQSLLNQFFIDKITGALILGTGGASKAVAAAMRDLNIQYKLVSRSPLSSDIYNYLQLDKEILKKYNLIVNTTPAGMWPDVDNCPALPYHLLTRSNICFDLTYNPPTTLFMKNCAARNVRVCNGGEMLELQAQLSWEIWNTPQT